MKAFNRRPKWIFSATTISLLIVWLGSARADDGSTHQSDQPRPIELGTTGGNINDISSAFCCSGTLGSLVEDTDGQYILSNNHVLARTNTASLGEYIIQPGLIDQSPVCSQDTNDVVAHLSDFVKIQFKKGKRVPLNEVDAAIAKVQNGNVDMDGSILDIGLVSANTVSAVSIGQYVQKSGRTTGLTFGEVAAFDVTVDVGYSKECGGGTNQVARFVNQIRITSGDFSAGGDSGSLVVEAYPADGLPRAVGLLFAGSSSSTLANPIGAVLSAFDVAMVSGTAPDSGPTGSISGKVTNSSDGSSDISGATVTVDTGQSATTVANGTYIIADVPTGDRSVTASATGFESQTEPATVTESQATIVDFPLTEATEPSQTIVYCVIYNTEGGKNQDKHLLITIKVIDDFGNPVSGAEVRIDVDLDDAFFGSGSGAITDANGETTYTAKNAPNGDYVTTVDVISDLTFEGSTPENLFSKGSDVVPDANCRGEASQPSGGAAHPGQQTQAAIDHARNVKARHETGLFAINGVVGTGVGLSDTGEPVIEVYLGQENAAARAQIPAGLEGVAVRVLVTGPFVAF